jgi:hypothetical protein
VSADLPPLLSYRLDDQRDPDEEGVHGFVEPTYEMSAEAFQHEIHGTRTVWLEVLAPE